MEQTLLRIYLKHDRFSKKGSTRSTTHNTRRCIVMGVKPLAPDIQYLKALVDL